MLSFLTFLKVLFFFFLAILFENSFVIGFLQVFQNVFDKACQSEGYSSVLIPDGKYMLGPVLFAGPCKGPMALVIKGALISHIDVGSYGNRLFHWITFYSIDRLVVGGGGSLDGRGPSAWAHNTCSKSKSCNPLPSVSVLDSTCQS